MDAFGPWRSLASALAWGARGPGFKSRRPDQPFQTFTTFNVLAVASLETNLDKAATPLRPFYVIVNYSSWCVTARAPGQRV